MSASPELNAWSLAACPFPGARRAVDGDPDSFSVRVRFATRADTSGVRGVIEVLRGAVVVRRGAEPAQVHPFAEVEWVGFGEDDVRLAHVASGALVLHGSTGGALRLPTVCWQPDEREQNVASFRWLAAAITARCMLFRKRPVVVPTGIDWEIEQSRRGAPCALRVVREDLDGMQIAGPAWPWDGALAPALGLFAVPFVAFGTMLAGVEFGLVGATILVAALPLLGVAYMMAAPKEVFVAWDSSGLEVRRWRTRRVPWSRVCAVGTEVGGVLHLLGVRRYSVVLTLDGGATWQVDFGSSITDPRGPRTEHVEWLAERLRERIPFGGPGDVPDAVRALTAHERR